jgi:hypothetical protein
MMTF